VYVPIYALTIIFPPTFYKLIITFSKKI